MKRNFLPVTAALFVCAILLTVAWLSYIEKQPSEAESMRVFRLFTTPSTRFSPPTTRFVRRAFNA